ncbi:MAG: T9SS type A sorting domain-containing protein [Bacteroidota bacterium]
MKKSIFILSFLLCLGLTNTALLAQDTQKCGEGPAEHTHRISSTARLCYPKADYPTSAQAAEQFYQDVLSTVKCDNSNCSIPDRFDCEAVLIKVLQRPTASQDSTNWCFFDNVTIEWKCTPCTRIRTKDKDVPSEEPEPERRTGLDANGPKVSYVEFHELELLKAPASIHKVYPNPTSGILHLKLNVAVPDSKVVMTISDLSGKTIRQKAYADVPVSLYHIQTDMSDQANGLYLMSVRVNDKLISTSKVSVQNTRF